MKRTTDILARPSWSWPVFHHVSIAVMLILLCHMVSARVVISRRTGDGDEASAKVMMEKPGVNNSPGVVDDEIQLTAGSNNEIDNSQDGGVKHVQRVPAPNGRSDKYQQVPPEESSDEETLESLEANREAFLEVLTDNAKHPHRKRKNRKHSNFILKFDEKLQRWSLTEQQSDEWFTV